MLILRPFDIRIPAEIEKHLQKMIIYDVATFCRNYYPVNSSQLLLIVYFLYCSCQWQHSCTDNFFIILILNKMDISKEDLPATLQAFDLRDNEEIFLAEQVVNNQSEIETFTTRYTGKLIKAKATVPANRYTNNIYDTTTYKKKGSPSSAIIVLIIIAILIGLAIYGYSTGWLQEKLHLNR